MLFFALDSSSKLVNVGQSQHLPDLLCPFCNQSVHSLKLVGQSNYHFFHTHKNSNCYPTVQQQLHLLFSNIPDNFNLTLPGYTHRIEQYSIHYPDYPQKFFTFPEQVYEVPPITLLLEHEDFIKIDLSIADVMAYHFNYDSYSFILIFNFFQELDVIPDYFDELIYYSSTVCEVTMPTKSIDVFQHGFAIESIFKNLSITYRRNEHLQSCMRKPQRLLHESYIEWVRQQSNQLKQLELNGIIKMRQT